MTRLSKMFVLIATLASIAVTPSLADRKPTLEERSRIETKLRELGYTSWDEIEFDEERNAWEVDDARMADGRDYDLKLNPQTLDVISRKLED
ncbi:MAG: PepSY domain-containing protein [Pseudomonadota bacterium]